MSLSQLLTLAGLILEFISAVIIIAKGYRSKTQRLKELTTISGKIERERIEAKF